MKEKQALQKLLETFAAIQEETVSLKGKLSVMRSKGIEDTGPLAGKIDSLTKALTIIGIDISQLEEQWPEEEIEIKVLS